MLSAWTTWVSCVGPLLDQRLVLLDGQHFLTEADEAFRDGGPEPAEPDHHDGYGFARF